MKSPFYIKEEAYERSNKKMRSEKKENKKNKGLPKEKTKKSKKKIGGQEDPEPTRYGDWEKKGISSDF